MAYAQPPGLGPPQADFEEGPTFGIWDRTSEVKVLELLVHIFIYIFIYIYMYCFNMYDIHLSIDMCIYIYMFMSISIFLSFFLPIDANGSSSWKHPYSKPTASPIKFMLEYNKQPKHMASFTGAKVKSFLLNCGVADSNLPVSTQSNTE